MQKGNRGGRQDDWQTDNQAHRQAGIQKGRQARWLEYVQANGQSNGKPAGIRQGKMQTSRHAGW